MKNNNVQASKVVGLPVYTKDHGELVDHVVDVLYDLRSHHVTALLVDKGGWFSEAKVISLKDVQSIGEDAVVVADAGVIQQAESYKNMPLAQVAKDKEYLRKTKMITETGNEIGEVTDVFFTLPEGTVTRFEVSEGLIDDAMEGRKVVTVDDIITVGEDATIVRTSTEQEVDEQVTGGIKKITQDIKPKAKQLQQDAKGAVKELQQDAKVAVEKSKNKYHEIKEDPQTQQRKDGVRGAFEELTEEAKQAVRQVKSKTKDAVRTDVVGKYLTKNILANDDEVIGERGEMITHEMLEQAKRNEVEGELYKYNTAKPLHE